QAIELEIAEPEHDESFLKRPAIVAPRPAAAKPHRPVISTADKTFPAASRRLGLSAPGAPCRCRCAGLHRPLQALPLSGGWPAKYLIPQRNDANYKVRGGAMQPIAPAWIRPFVFFS
ncbi:hypothetical protein, partial [Chitiniphilus shinanonensis]|uniref:hypothetical protein n=1 Tax=Chitiniphilus shinanonensis TaxID=553088 RepID=UPI0033407895